MRLGKTAPRVDTRTLRFANYLATGLPSPPQARSWSSVVRTWPLFRNDVIGDCTCASAGHHVLTWNANQHVKVAIDDKQIVQAYAAVSGYNPTTGTNDNGAAMLDVLNFWRRDGVGGRRISAYTALDLKNDAQVRAGLWLFGGVYTGLALPLSAKVQTRRGIWSVVPGGPRGQAAPGTWGGHAVAVLDYDAKYLTCVTWGKLLKMTWQFWKTYCDEAYVILSDDWVTLSRRSPSGFDLAALQRDLAAL